MAVNVDRLRAELEWVTDHQDRLNLNEWIEETECGTAGCLAGWTVLHEPGVEICPFELNWVQSHDAYVSDLARDILGLTEDQADTLFLHTGSLADLWRVASRITDGAIQAPAGVAGGA